MRAARRNEGGVMNLRITSGGIALIGCAIGAPEITAMTPDSDPDLSRMRQRLGALSVPFVPNAGQWDARAAFAAQTFAGTLFVTTDGQLVYSLPGRQVDDPTVDTAEKGPPVPTTSTTNHARLQRAGTRAPGGVLTETLVDGEGRALTLTPQGLRPQPTRVSYFIGSETSRHQSALATFEQV